MNTAAARPSFDPTAPRSPHLQVEGLTVQNAQATKTLLQGISFSLQGGAVVGLVGASGSGKTSLLRSLNRLVELSAGQIHLDGTDLRQVPIIELRRRVVLVPQESKLLGMTVQDALTYPLTLQRLPATTIRQRLNHWLEQLRLPTEWLDRTEVQLSLGQRQRVAIARALIMEPAVLLLDEPTSSLDIGQAIALMELLQQLSQTGTLMLVANHQLSVLAQRCDRVLQLHHGKLVGNTTAGETDWDAIKQAMIAAEAEQAAEWDDDGEDLDAPATI